jgi:peptide deformylase
MTVRTILVAPDYRLRELSQPVPDHWLGLSDLIQDMTDTLRASGGIGLAAPQIGELWRVVVIDLSQGESEPLVLVNPMVSNCRGTTSMEEGCLSVPEQRARVPRYGSLSVVAGNAHGEMARINASGLLAICIQHEVDHLNGRLILDPQ